MSKSKIKSFLREAILLLGIVLAAVVIELVIFNFRTFIGNDEINIRYREGKKLPAKIESVSKEDQVITLTLQDVSYIQKMRVTFDSTEKIIYTVKVLYNNIFDAESQEQIREVYWPELGKSFANIGKEVKTVQLVVPAGMTDCIKSIRLYTKTQINEYRLVFVAMVLFFIVLFFRKWRTLVKKPERIVLIVGGLLGSYFIYMNGIQENGWDEQIHFRTAYNMSFFGDQVENNETIEKMTERISQEAYNTYEEKSLWEEYLNQKYDEKKELIANTSGWTYKNTGYMLQAFAIGLGRKLNLRFLQIYRLGRSVNLWMYLILMYWSIKLIPRRKELILALALFPTSIFIASTYTYDATVNGLLMLGFSLWLKAVVENKKERTIYYLIGSMAAIGIGSLSKAIYIPLLLLCILVPKEKYQNKKQYYIFWGIVLGVGAVVALSFIGPMLYYTLTSQLGITGDVRGGNTDAVLQLKSIFHHPLQYGYILLRDILQSAGNYIWGHAGVANFGRLAELNKAFLYMTFPWMLFIMFHQSEEDKYRLSKRYQCGMGAAVGIVIIFIWTAMYLTYTPVGQDWINGVQGRYYFPVLAPLFCMLPSINKQDLWKKPLRLKVISGVPVICLLVEMSVFISVCY